VTLYDEVAYPGRVFSATQPDRLAAIALLHGLGPAPVEACRILELGCGDGTNLIAMAHAWPGTQCVGIDVAERPIERGRARVQGLRLANIRLDCLDVRDVPEDAGTFDYIVAHGLWSWVPSDARAATLRVIARHLAPDGVAFISYLTYPGSHLRNLLRDMLLFHGRDARSAQERVARARELASMLTASPADATGQRAFPRLLATDLADLDDGVLFHDWLADVNVPVTVTEFAAFAAEHDLAFLGEAEYHATRYEHDPDLAAVRGALVELEKRSVLLKEQYLDFLRCRTFRQTLLCHAALDHDPMARAERLERVAIASALRPESEEPDIRSRARERFRTPGRKSLETDHPAVKAALVLLGDAWPAWIPFPELLRQARAAARRADADEAADRSTLAGVLFQCLAANYVEIHAAPVPFTMRPGERPRASELARLALTDGVLVPTLRAEYVRMDDELGAGLLRLLDGTRRRADLVRGLASLIESGTATLTAENQRVTDPARVRRILERDLDDKVAGLARLALLIE
jgi:SAM-dependent methyltransferase